LRYYSLEELERVLPAVLEKVRGEGHRVGTGEALSLLQLARSYAALEAREHLSEDELRLIVEGVLKREAAVESFMRHLRMESAGSRLREAAERLEGEIAAMLREMGVAPGWRVSKRIVKRGKRGRDARRSLGYYLMLKRIGVIRGRPGNERVADPQAIRSIAFSLARRGYESVEKAYEDLRPAGGRDYRLMEAEARVHPRLESLSEGQLLQLGEASIRKGNYETLRSVAERLAALAARGELRDAARAARILEAAGLRDPGVAEALLIAEPRLAERLNVPPETVARAASKAPGDRAGEIVARALRRMGREEALKLLSLVDPQHLWAVKRHPFTGDEAALLEAAVKASRGLREAVAFHETGNPGRRDMAVYLAGDAAEAVESLGGVAPLGRVSVETVKAMARLAEGLAAADSPGEVLAGDLIARMKPGDAVTVLRSLYSRASPEERELLLAAAERLLARLSGREGLRLLPKWVTGGERGRVDVRRSVYRLVRRSPEPLVYRRRLKSRRIVLALDVSGSMIEHSAWAASIAMLFARNVERLVTFSGAPRVVEGPLKPRELARALLEAEFRGLTNVAAALRASEKPGVRSVVLVSDLKQTVAGEEPLEAAAERLVRRGHRIVAVVPRGHDAEAAARLEAVGARVVYAPTPRLTAVHLLRVLLRTG